MPFIRKVQGKQYSPSSIKCFHTDFTVFRSNYRGISLPHRMEKALWTVPAVQSNVLFTWLDYVDINVNQPLNLFVLASRRRQQLNLLRWSSIELIIPGSRLESQ